MQTRARAAAHRAKSTAENQAGDVLQLVLAHIEREHHVNVISLACLCLVSHQFNAEIRRFIGHNLGSLLPRSLHEAAITSVGYLPQAQVLSGVEWLLEVVDHQVPQEVVANLVKVPQLPSSVIQAVLASGARITFQQLAAAARCRVLGVESWVTICIRSLHKKTGLPSVVDSICKGESGINYGRLVTPANVQDLLHIAVNKIDSSAATMLLDYLLQPRSSKAAQRLQHELMPALLEQLLITAVERNAVMMTERLMQLISSLNLQLSASVVVTVLQSSLALGRRSAIVTELCKPHLTSRLDEASCEAVMRTAVHRNNINGLSLLSHTAAAQSMPPVAVERLLTAALAVGSGRSFEGYYAHMLVGRMVSLPGAGSLQPSRIAGLVRTAICSMPHPVSRQESIRSLLSLPAAPSMDQATLSSLLQAAVQVTDHAAAMIICEQVPGVQLLEASVIDMLLCTAIQQSNSITFLAMDEEHGGDAAAEPPLIKMLCELPAAASVNAQPLIRLAVQQRAVKLLPCLCKRLQRLDLSGLSQLLAEAVQLREYSSVKHLLAAQAAQQLGTERIVELLESAVRDGQEVAAGALVELPGAQQLQVDAVAKLLQGAVRQRLKEVPQQLAQLPSANSLSAEQLTFLLGEAVRQQLPAAVSALCKLQPATQLGLQFVAQQLQQSLKLKMDCQSVEALCGLLLLTDERQAALDAATFNAVLELALERQHLRPVAALLDTPVAERELNVQRVQQLLLHAVEQHNDSAVDILVGLDAAQGIAEPDVQRLFEAGIRVGCCGMMMDLCELEGSGRLSAEAVCSLMLAALRAEWAEGIDLIAERLEGSDQIATSDCEVLLQTALRQLDTEAVSCLVCIAGARKLPPSSVKSLLHLALTNKCAEPVVLFCRLEAAQLLSTAEVEDLIVTALQMRSCSEHVVAPLFRLPAVQQLSSNSIQRLLMVAVASGSKSAVPKLCGLPAAAAVEAATAATVLQVAVEQQDLQAVTALCRLPSVRQLAARDVLCMLRAALHETDGYSITTSAGLVAQQLIKLPQAAAFPADAVTELLQLGTQNKLSAEVSRDLFQLHAAALRRPRQHS